MIGKEDADGLIKPKAFIVLKNGYTADEGLFDNLKAHVKERADPETLRLLQSALEETWDTLRPDERARTSKAVVAQRIIMAILAGERDEARLRIEAVSGAVTSAL